MVEVKQKHSLRPAFAGAQVEKVKAQIGVVVWVHPLRRYAVVEFDGVYGKPREGFHMDHLTAKNFAGYKEERNDSNS